MGCSFLQQVGRRWVGERGTPIRIPAFFLSFFYYFPRYPRFLLCVILFYRLDKSAYCRNGAIDIAGFLLISGRSKHVW